MSPVSYHSLTSGVVWLANCFWVTAIRTTPLVIAVLRPSRSTTSYSYDKADRITAVGTTSYSVDGAGNLTAQGFDSTMTYDQANRLTSYQHFNPSWQSTYTYNGDGLLMEGGAGGAYNWYLYDVTQPLPVVLQDQPATMKYIWGLGLAYSVDSMANINVMHSDALSSVRSLTDANGSVVATYQRDTFGKRTGSSGQSTQPFDFTGDALVLVPSPGHVVEGESVIKNTRRSLQARPSASGTLPKPRDFDMTRVDSQDPR